MDLYEKLKDLRFVENKKPQNCSNYSNMFWDNDYVSLEKDFLNFIQYVPLSGEHDDVWSIKLANLILLVGSSVDSFFKCYLKQLRDKHIESYINYPKFQFIGLKNDKEEWEIATCQLFGYCHDDFKLESDFYRKLLDNNRNIGLYRDFFEENYNFSEKIVYVMQNKTKLKPFQEWSEDKSPEWWLAFRALKHDKFKNLKKATLKNAINVLGALFLLNVTNIYNQPYLYGEKVIKSNSNIYFDRGADVSLDEIDTLEPIIAKTSLFGYFFDGSGWKHNPWDILDSNNIFGL